MSSDEKPLDMMCRHDLGDRTKLPYRAVAECYISYNANLVAQDKGKYIAFQNHRKREKR